MVYEVSNGCITPDNSNIEVIKNLKAPTNAKELQWILVSRNLWWHFNPKYAKARAPLNNLLKKNVLFDWNQNCNTSFKKLKKVLTQKLLLKLYDPKKLCH